MVFGSLTPKHTFIPFSYRTGVDTFIAFQNYILSLQGALEGRLRLVFLLLRTLF